MTPFRGAWPADVSAISATPYQTTPNPSKMEFCTVAIGDLYQLTFNINCAGEETECTLGYEQDAGSNDADTLEAMCKAFEDDVVPSLLLAISSGVSVDRIRADTVTDHQEVPGLIDYKALDGLVAGPALPAQMCALIHLPTNAPSAKHNGRIYLSGLSIAAQQEGTIDNGPLALLQTFADKLAIDLAPTAPQDANFTPVVISRVVNKAPRVPPIGFPVLIPLAKPSMRQQRRRKTPHFGLR